MSCTQQAAIGERADLQEALTQHRYFLRYTVRDLTDEQATRRTTVSELCLGGLIKHVTAMEREWINFILDGPSALGPWDETSISDRSGEFSVLEGETLAALLDEYDKVAAGPMSWWRRCPISTSPIPYLSPRGSNQGRAGQRGGRCST